MGDGLGATHVVSPNVSGAVWVASVLVRLSAAAFLDVTAPGSHLSRHIDHATVGSGSMVAGGPLARPVALALWPPSSLQGPSPSCPSPSSRRTAR